MRTKKVKCLLVAILSIMMIFSSINPSMLAVTFAAEDEGSTPVEDVVKNVLTYSNVDTEEVQKGKSNAYTVTVTGKDDFADGSSVYLSEIIGKDLDGCMEGLNTYLKEDMLSAECVLPLFIGFFDEDGNEAQPGQKVDVVLSLADTKPLKKTMLYHQTEDGSWEKVAYRLFETDEGTGVEFSTDTFSPFIFVTENVIEQPEEEVVQEEQNKNEKVEGDQQKAKEENQSIKKDSEEAVKSEQKTEPEKKDEDVKKDESKKADSEQSNEVKEDTKKAKDTPEPVVIDEESGMRSQVGDVDAVALYGKAAKDEETAVNTLKRDLSFSKKEAGSVADELFSKAKGEAVRSGDEDVPRQGDGTNIESINAKWITLDTVDNDNNSLLYYKPEGTDAFNVRLQINYSLSGEHNYEPGDITITIPENIIRGRTGNYTGEVVLPFPEDPSTKSDFNWKLVNGNLVITNTKRMSAATKGYIQVGFDNLLPRNVVDMQVSDEFDAYIEVTTHKGNTLALRSNKLTAQFDTEALLREDSVAKRQYGKVERVSAESIPASQRVGDETEYILVRWYMWGYTTANTYYTMDVTDSIPQNATVTESGLKESDIHGFVIGASGDGTALVQDDLYHGYNSGQTRYYYYETAYPASQFEPNVQYTFHNKVHVAVTEDDSAAEVTNPNVQTEDPQLVTEDEASASVAWSYTLPKWNDPEGHFMIAKNGNDGTSKNNVTHHSYYSGSSYSDNHIITNRRYADLWYGIYPSAMNELQEGNNVQLSYTINTVGYTMPWMFDDTTYITDGDVAPRKSVNYRIPVTLVSEDTGLRLNERDLTVFDDYKFVSVEFCSNPYVYTGTPKNINPDGTWTALTAGDGTFEYVSDSNVTHYPDIMLQIYRNGTWEDYAVASWSSGEMKVSLVGGAEISGTVVDVPADTENIRTKVVLQNTLGENNENLITQAAIDYDVRPIIELIDTDEVKDLVDAGFNETNTPAIQLYNSVHMSGYKNGNEEAIVSIDKEGYDDLRGYTADTTICPKKTAKQTLKDADYVNRRVTVHYSAKVEERSVINDNVTYMQAVEDGRLTVETHGYWYDLLPKGVTPDLTTIQLRSGDRILDARTIENYKDSGRTLLVVEVSLMPSPERYLDGDVYHYKDVPTISFDAYYDFDALTDYGKTIHNVIAFESGNDFIGTVDGYKGEPDNPNTGNDNNVSTADAFANDNEKAWMTNLDENRDTPSFVYAGTTTTIDIISAARISLQKDVMVNNDGLWGSGVFSSKVNPDSSYTYNENSKAENEMVVWEGGFYTYRLRMMPDDETRAKNMIIYDSLETFKAGDGNEPIDEIAANQNATWQGILKSVDVSQLEDKGCAPVVYYSTIENLALSDESNPDVGNPANMLYRPNGTLNSDVWIKAEDYHGDLSAVKAIAVDASKDVNGGEFSIEPLESVVVMINMQAPSDEEAAAIIANNGAWGTSSYAYNNTYLTGTTIDVDTLDEDGDNFVRKDYTKVGLKEHSFDVKKNWVDDNNRDGIRPENITVHLYADGSDTGKILTLNESNNWEGAFEHIPYANPDGTKIHYTVVEDSIDQYTTDIAAAGTSAKIKNTHEPEKIDLSVSKSWVGDEANNRPSSITVELYANGNKIKTKRIDSSNDWSCTFTDLFKNENGEPIVYTAKETFPNGDSKHLSYVSSEPDGLVLTDGEAAHTFTNTYHPYGDMYVAKTVKNVTNVSKDQEFEFTFKFTKIEDGETVPVFEGYAYDVLDENDEVILSGEVANNESVKIKGGQKIHVKDIDEYVNYVVEEKAEDGFRQSSASNAGGRIVPNKDTQVAFENSYSATGKLSVSADKVLQNRQLNKYQFRFELYQIVEEFDENNNVIDTHEELIRTATNDAPDETIPRENGSVESSHAVATFGSITYTQDDVNKQAQTGRPYTYKIIECDGERDGYTYDDSVYYVEVALTDNGDGTISVVPTYYKEAEQGGLFAKLFRSEPDWEQVEKAEFKNRYDAEGEITLKAWKDLHGRTLENEEFGFELIDKDGNPIYKVDPITGEITEEPYQSGNADDGSVTFDAIHYDATDIGVTYIYGIRELAGGDWTVNYDENTYGYAVTVYDNGDGTLSFDQSLVKPVFEDAECTDCRGKTDVEYMSYYGEIWGTDDIYWPLSGYPTVMPSDETVIENFIDAFYGYIDEHGVDPATYEKPDFTHGALYDRFIACRVDDTNLIGLFNQVMDMYDKPHAEAGDILYCRWQVARATDQEEPNIVFGSRNVGFYCSKCNGTGVVQKIVDWTDEGAEFPVFKNNLKDGNLSVSKYIDNSWEADPNQEFRFKVKLIGPDVEDKDFEYYLSRTGGGGLAEKSVKSSKVESEVKTPELSKDEPTNKNFEESGDKSGQKKDGSFLKSSVDSDNGAPDVVVSDDRVSSVEADTSKGVIENNVSGKSTAAMRVNRDGGYTVTYDANGGTFDGGATTNVVGYADIGDPLTKIIKSDNVIDAETATGPFYQSTDTSKAVTIPGASRLEVKVTYRHGSQYDNNLGGLYYHLAIFKGTSSSYSNETNRVAYVSSSTKKTETYTVEGDTTQFWWRNYRSAGSVTNWTGIYAEITGYDSDGNVITCNSVSSGTYKEPTPNSSTPAHTQFVSWNTEPNGSGTTMDSEAIASLSADTTLYAQYNTVIVAQDTGSNHWWKIYGDGSLVIGTGAPADSPYTIPIAPNAQSWPWYSQGYGNLVKSISFDGHVNASSNVSRIFSNLPNLTDVNLTGFHSGPTTSMNGLFQDDISLVSINVGDLDFTNTTNLAYFFQGCSSLKTVTGLDGKSFPALTGINNMFSGCSSLESISISNIDAPLLRSLQRMFGGCTNLETVSLINWNVPALTTMQYMFVDDSSLKNVSFTNIETPDLENMAYMFQNCSALENLDLSSIETDSSFATTYYMFDGCYSLKTLDISSMDTSNATNMGYMFRGCNKLEQITLGENFNFKGNGLTASNRVATLPTPSGDSPDGKHYNGKWIRDDGECGPFTPVELRDQYNSTMAGTWVRDTRNPYYTVSFWGPDNLSYAGYMPNEESDIDQDFTLPKCRLMAYGYDFDHWEDANGNVYEDEGVIPANTYEDGDYIYLMAVFTPRDTTASMHDGEFEFTLRGGERATFPDIPAGTMYQVYEETPNGWILVSQWGVAGEIQPLETSGAEFTNRYEPGVATAQFSGTKTLDGQAAEQGSYLFELDETTEGASGTIMIYQDWQEQEVELPLQIPVSQGGFIQFPVIKYSQDDIGVHTYTIKEINPDDYNIDYDSHVENITVNVTGDVTELHTDVSIDPSGDGKIAFANKTRPGSLRIDKIGYNVTDTNKDDEFTFKVTLYNEKGLPLDGDSSIYWYTTDLPQSGGEVDIKSATKSEKSVKDETTKEIDGVVFEATPNDVKSSGEQTRGESGAKAADDIASGTSGTCSWVIDANGTLTISPTDGVSGTLGSMTYDGSAPWYSNRSTIQKVVVAPGVATHRNAAYMFYCLENCTTMDVSNLDTSAATNMEGMFFGCKKVTTLDVASWDVSNVTNMAGMFGVCYKLASLNIDNWQTGALTKVSLRHSSSIVSGASSSIMFGMFASCRALTELDLRGFNVTNVPSFSNMFAGCVSLSKLDISTWDMSGLQPQNSSRDYYIMNNFFGESGTYMPTALCSNLKELVLGPNFKFGLDGETSYRAMLPTPSGSDYSGKWIREDEAYGPYTAIELRNNYNSDMAGTWIWQLDQNKGTVIYDANEGVITGSTSEVATIDNPTVILPNEDRVTRYHYDLVGWNTKSNGSGDHYDVGATYAVPMGQTTTLYAEWATSMKRTYTVKHYQESLSLNNYSLVETETGRANIGTQVTPEVKSYENFISPEPQTVEIPDSDDLVIEYRYNRPSYILAIDGNGATSGTNVSGRIAMDAPLHLGEIGSNWFSKTGSIFTGWNTEPDGSGVSYGPNDTVVNLTDVNGATVTLYAQWMDNPNEPLTPEGGVLYVTCKAGEAIVIPDLPAGTTYTVEEVGMGDGWQQVYSYDTEGTIYPNWTSDSWFYNGYMASGDLYVTAHKQLIGGTLTEGQFKFIAETDLDYDYGPVRSTYHTMGNAVNDALDTNATITDDEGVESDNPWYNTAPVTFGPFNVSLGEEGYYIVRTLNNEFALPYGESEFDIRLSEIAGDDYTIFYDDHEEIVHVTIIDLGHGQLGFELEYDDDGPLFTNTKEPATLYIYKDLDDGVPEDLQNTEFEMVVELKDANGNPLTGSYPYEVTDNIPKVAKGVKNTKASSTGTISSGDTVTIHGGEVIIITDLPDGVTYTVTEKPKDNWTLVASDGTEGSIDSGYSGYAWFLNAYEEPPYSAEGQAQIRAKKTVVGATIKESDNFVFELLDESGNVIQRKNVDAVGANSSTVTFDPISYVETDAATPVEYDVQVMLMRDGSPTPLIITLDPQDYQVTHNGAKTSISGIFNWSNEYAGCDRTNVVISAVPKDDSLSDYTQQQVFNMDEDYSANFIFNDLTGYDGGQYHYTIREQRGTDSHMKYDTVNYDAVVTVIDTGEGYLTTNVEYYRGEDAVTEAEFVNKKLFDVNIAKKDSVNLEAIPGAKFVVKCGDKYLHADGTLSDQEEKFTTDNAGRIDLVKIPAGSYVLHETDAPSGYIAADDISFQVNEDGIFVGTIDDNNKVDGLLVLEDFEPHSISVDKTVTGNAANMNDEFTFRITLSGDNVPDSVAYKILGASGEIESGTKVLTSGQAEFTLKHAQQIVFSNLPYGVSYTVTELNADSDNYTTSVTATSGTVGTNKAVTGTLTSDESISYVNNRESVVPTSVDYRGDIVVILLAMAVFAAIAIRRRKKSLAK